MRRLARLGVLAALAACAAPPDPVAVDDEAARRPNVSPEQLAEMTRRQAIDREIADAHAAGRLGDRATRERLLLVDARPPAGVGQVQYLVVAGELPQARVAQLRNLRRAEVEGKRWTLQQGEDAARAAVFGSVEPGVYTVCAQVGPTLGPPRPMWRNIPVRCLVHSVTDDPASRAVVVPGVP